MELKRRDIKYLNRDFLTNKESLVNFLKTYFPDTYNDFSPESLGMMFIELNAYIGDILSFYTDNQLQELFPQDSRIIKNLYKHSYNRGYTPKITSPSIADVEISHKVNAVGGNPNYSNLTYIPVNTLINSDENPNVSFLLTEPVDFNFSSSYDPTEVEIFEMSGHNPSSFLLTKKRSAISAQIEEQTFAMGDYERFKSIEIRDSNIIGILEIKDSDNNLWYEVPNLASDIVYEFTPNTNADSQLVPYELDTKRVQRRYITRFIDEGILRIEFGAGNVDDTDVPVYNFNDFPNPYIESTGSADFNFKQFLKSPTYGISPSKTTLTVKYLKGGGVRSNVPSNVLNTIGVANPDITCTNPEASTGGSGVDTVEYLRVNSINNFQAQDRAVTQRDYLTKCLSMPARLGSIAKAHITPSLLRDSYSMLDLYILSYGLNKTLTPATSTLKTNLRNYLSKYRMINDYIEIKDAFVVNIGVNFGILVRPDNNVGEVMLRCVNELRNYFNIDRWQINQPIILKDIYLLLDKVQGVQTVNDVAIINKVGNEYSDYEYNIQGATANNIVYPSIDPMIFEVKFPLIDIKGRSSNF